MKPAATCAQAASSSVVVMKKWKKILAVGCSHGALADRAALDAVTKFRQTFKPDLTVHLGDWCDTAAFRTGAAGTADEAAPLDVAIGLQHLEDLGCNVVLMGNHEDRIYRLARHHNTIVRTAAMGVLETIEDWITKRMHARIIAYDGNRQGFYCGGYRYMHGTMFSEQCIRDHAEAFGNTVFAHSHRPGMAHARTCTGARAFNTGWLGDVNRAEYAKARRSTLSWGQGFVWGYYTDNQSQLWLHEKQGNTWTLPA